MTETVTPIRLTRAEASKYLKEHHRISYTPKSLAKLAVTGDGPKFRKPNARLALYDRCELDRWANEKLGPEFGSTAEIPA